MPTAEELVEMLLANPALAFQVVDRIRVIGPWEAWGPGRPENTTVRRQPGLSRHVVVVSVNEYGRHHPSNAFVAWVTYPGVAQHAHYGHTEQEAMDKADAGLRRLGVLLP